MFLRVYQPESPLRDFIENFWLYEDYVPQQPHDRILPSGTFEMVFNLREDELRIYDPAQPDSYRRYPGALVSGPYRGFFVIDTRQERALLGVHFKPGGAYPFLGLSADALSDTHVSLETLWGRSAILLRERLCTETVPEERFRIVEDALREHLFRPLEHHYAVLSGLDALGADPSLLSSEDSTVYRVRDIARYIGLSERRFIQVFRAEVGLTPRRFYRIQRFHRALALLGKASATPDGARVAAECGFFDQSHLIHDFEAFSGVSPQEYVRRQQRLQQAQTHIKHNHLPIVEPPAPGSVFYNDAGRPDDITPAV
jgi:AraC-like DNA-binding protein